MNIQTLHFCKTLTDAVGIFNRLDRAAGKKPVIINWPDTELIDSFNRGRCTDLVMTYTAGYWQGLEFKADAIVHHDLPIEARNTRAVLNANGRANTASIVYKYSDHFEYQRAPFSVYDQVAG
jgi:hypothetical protein